MTHEIYFEHLLISWSMSRAADGTSGKASRMGSIICKSLLADNFLFMLCLAILTSTASRTNNETLQIFSSWTISEAVGSSKLFWGNSVFRFHQGNRGKCRLLVKDSKKSRQLFLSRTTQKKAVNGKNIAAEVTMSSWKVPGSQVPGLHITDVKFGTLAFSVSQHFLSYPVEWNISIFLQSKTSKQQQSETKRLHWPCRQRILFWETLALILNT